MKISAAVAERVCDPVQSADVVLVAEGLTKMFGGFAAVKDVNLAVRRGSIHAIIGPNGAGKTTCFNLLTKTLQPTSGRIVFDGEDISALRSADVSRRGLVRSFQISATFPNLTARENVRVALQSRHGTAYHFWRSLSAISSLNSRADQLLEQVGLVASRDALASELSYGKKRALEIATTLALEPKMMLLDEPTAGMGHEDIGPITDLIRKAAEGRTVLLVEHNLSVVSTLCDRITVLQHGQKLAEGTYSEVSNNPDVINAYLEASMKSSVASAVAPGPAAPILAVENLHAWYADSRVLHGMNFDVREGELLTLIGRNGAGKTTTLRSIMGLVKKRTGSIRLGQDELIGRRTFEIARKGIAYCPEERAIFAGLSVRENLLLPPMLRDGGLTDEQLFSTFPNLKARASSPGTKLSGGEQQMLAIARILRTGSRLLLLDEPSEGLAPVVVKQIAEIIQRLKTQGYTIVLVEQNLRFAKKIADRHVVVENGKVVDIVANDELDSRMDQLKTYIGV